jgi:hypothetical protein
LSAEQAGGRSKFGETLEGRFADIAETQPELLARHCTDAGLIEKAAGLWGKAGQRSLARAALLEGVEQLKRALDQIARRKQTVFGRIVDRERPVVVLFAIHKVALLMVRAVT